MLEELCKARCAPRTCTGNIEIRAIAETEKKDFEGEACLPDELSIFFPFSKQQQTPLLKKIKSPWCVISDLSKT